MIKIYDLNSFLKESEKYPTEYKGLQFSAIKYLLKILKYKKDSEMIFIYNHQDADFDKSPDFQLEIFRSIARDVGFLFLDFNCSNVEVAHFIREDLLEILGKDEHTVIFTSQVDYRAICSSSTFSLSSISLDSKDISASDFSSRDLQKLTSYDYRGVNFYHIRKEIKKKFPTAELNLSDWLVFASKSDKLSRGDYNSEFLIGSFIFQTLVGDDLDSFVESGNVSDLLGMLQCVPNKSDIDWDFSSTKKTVSYRAKRASLIRSLGLRELAKSFEVVYKPQRKTPLQGELDREIEEIKFKYLEAGGEELEEKASDDNCLGHWALV